MEMVLDIAAFHILINSLEFLIITLQKKKIPKFWDGSQASAVTWHFCSTCSKQTYPLKVNSTIKLIYYTIPKIINGNLCNINV